MLRRSNHLVRYEHVTSTLGASATGLERKPTVGVLSSFEFSQLGRSKSLNAI